MRQILCNSNGAFVARAPRPAVEPGQVLIRVHYSLVSVGTEIAALKPPSAQGAPIPTPFEKTMAMASVARRNLGLAIQNPDDALRYALRITKRQWAKLFPEHIPAPKPALRFAEIQWTRNSATAFAVDDQSLTLTTDDSTYGYQAMAQKISIPDGRIPVVRLKGRVEQGMLSIGLLNHDRALWLGARSYDAGPFEDRLIFQPGDSPSFTLVIAKAGDNATAQLTLQDVEIAFASPMENGLPLSELDDQGWNVGYSAAGQVLAVGTGVHDITVGDMVACGGAGKANHADFVSVPRNLVCPVPSGCSLQAAATTTVGIIAMQGVRRAAPQLGESVCVLGLGLIGQMTVQLLQAAGTTVIGLDLDPDRVRRAKSLGMELGTHDSQELEKMVRDATLGMGADITIITAATKSDIVINAAMKLTRRKGRVIIVGDVGMNIQRADFYKKEIDLLMSTSYGPGRYDRAYEEQGIDYPLPYVRWTLNRNMQSYMALIATKKIRIDPLIDKIISVDEAPAAYRELASNTQNPPLGVLIRYPDDARNLPEPPDATRISIRGHRSAPDGPTRYALVGAGAFGISMLVPQLAKYKERFFLGGVVSSDAIRGGNFARANQIEVMTSQINDVLHDPRFQLMVIATRHDLHAQQTIQSLRAGKHVFVEKPLALTWNELNQVAETYLNLPEKPILMVGFNRRFAPAIQMLHQLLAERRAPLMINYRLNAGYIPLDHWVHGPQGGGRNIGEACHMYDLFRFLAQAPVTSIQAVPIRPGTRPYRADDNFTATIAFADGSIGNLLYTALGPKSGLPKERIEVFCDGECYLVDDFKALIRTSTGETLWRSESHDKGHAEEISQLASALNANIAPPIPFEHIMEASAVALHVQDLLMGVVSNEGFDAP